METQKDTVLVTYLYFVDPSKRVGYVGFIMKKLLLLVTAAAAIWLIFRDSRPQRILKSTAKIMEQCEIPAFSKEESKKFLEGLKALDKKDPARTERMENTLKDCKKETNCLNTAICLITKLAPANKLEEAKNETQNLADESSPSEP